MGDPIFPEPSPVPPAPGHPGREKRGESGADWIVIHRGGAGSKAHVEALERKLIKAKIPSKVEHDEEHRVVLEVPRERQEDAMAVIGRENVNHVGADPYQTAEERLEAEQRAALSGPFKAATAKWLLVVLAVAVLSLLALYMLRW